MDMKFKEEDFEIQWFSGTGNGGQYKNKHQNSCRVIHKATGIRALGTNQRNREANKKAAMEVCIARVKEHFHEDTERFRATDERVRTYHEPDNRVVDHLSKKTDTYKRVVINGNIGSMIEARAQEKRNED